MDQLCLPMDLEEDIPQNHCVRVVNAVINRLDDRIFASAYPGGGRDSFHPKMLTKIIVYAYTQRIYSSRQIAKAIRENVMFMWIAGRPQLPRSCHDPLYGTTIVFDVRSTTSSSKLDSDNC
jgi:transposase